MLALALPGLIERTSEATDETHEETLATFIDLYHKYDWTSANGKLLVLHQAHINKLAERQGGGGSQKDDEQQEGDERTPDRRPAAADSTQRKTEPDDAAADLADLMATAASAGNGSDGLTQLVRYLRDEGGGDTAKQVVRLLTEQYNVGTPAARAAATGARSIARANDHNLRPLIALIAVLMRTPHIEPRLKSFVESFVIPECQLHPFLQGRVDTFSFSSRAKSLRNALGRLRKAIRKTETITLSDHGADTVDMLAELVAIFIVNLNVPPLLRLMDWVAVGKRVGELSGSTSLSTLRTMGDQEKSSDANEAIRRHVKICPHTHGYYGKIDIDDLAGLTYTTTAAADRIIEDLDGDDERQGNGRTAARLTAGSEKETERESNKEKEKIDLNKIPKGARDQFFQHELARRLGPYLPGRCIRCSNKHPGGWTQCTADLGPLEKNHAKILKDIPQLGGILAALDVLAAVK